MVSFELLVLKCAQRLQHATECNAAGAAVSRPVLPTMCCVCSLMMMSLWLERGLHSGRNPSSGGS